MINIKELLKLLDDETKEIIKEIEKNCRLAKRYGDEIIHLNEEEIISSYITPNIITIGDYVMPLFDSIIALDMFLIEQGYDLKTGTYICTIDGNELYEIIYEDSESNMCNRLVALKEVTFNV